MSEISVLVWAQHIQIDYAQNIRKDPNRAKIRPLENFCKIQGPSFQFAGYLRN